MDYPATQMFVNDEEEEESEEEEVKKENDDGTPLRMVKTIKIGTVVTDLNTYPVFQGANTVGRLDTCSIIIDHNTISKEHAEIEAGLGSKSIFISDLKSLNKTKLNDTVLRPGRLYQLQNDDVLRFGSVKAVFKVEETGREKRLDQSKVVNFVIPESPLPISKEIQPTIPDSPDLSFERLSTEVNRSSDASLITVTQEGGNVGGGTSPILSGKLFTVRELSQELDFSAEDEDGNLKIIKNEDVPRFETQKNITIDDSDEENIFDMMTQKSDIHDEDTQKFSNDNVQTIVPSRFTQVEARSVEDVQTQKLSNGVDKSCSVSDLATQKSSDDRTELHPTAIHDLETQKFSVEQIDANSSAIHDLETQKFLAEQTDPRDCSINNLETQKFEAIDKNDEDSETDEEGIFERSGDVEDMFDAPTQVIKLSRKGSESPCEIVENKEKENEEEKETIEEKKDEAEKVPTIVEDEAAEIDIEINGKTTTKLNDSIESKLNHMFEEMNESGVDEPTQMLTQHLENILETTQHQEFTEVHQQGGEIFITENTLNRNGNIIDDSDDESVRNSNSDTKERPEILRKSDTPDIQVPELLNSEELFSDLPAVDFLRISSAKEKPETESSAKVEKSKDVEVEKIEAVQSGSENLPTKSKRSGSTEKDAKRSKRIKNAESKITEPANKLSENISIRRPRNRNLSVKKLEKLSSKAEEPVTQVTETNLPIKKRGSSIVREPPTIVEVILTPRLSTRSNIKTQSKTQRRPTKLSDADGSKTSESKRSTSNSMMNANSKKSKSPTPVLPDEIEALNKIKKTTRSRKIADTTSLQTDLPLTIEAGSTRRLRKKPLDTSNETTDEESTPIKRPRITPKDRKNIPNPIDEKISRSFEPGIIQTKSLQTRNRKGKPNANSSSNANTSGSALGIENIDNTVQPSLESQEIQAILGVGNPEDGESRVSSTSRYRKESNNVRSRRPVIGIKQYEKEDSQDFLGFPETETPNDTAEHKLGKPVGISERRKRQLRQPELEASKNEDEAPSKKSAKPRSQKNTETVEKKNEKNISVESVGTPATRGTKRTVSSRRAAERAEKENVVAETTLKKTERKKIFELKSDEEIQTSQSSSSPLRRGRSSLATPVSAAKSSISKIKHKILFTGFNDQRLISMVNNLGGTITEKPNDCTVLVTDKVRRTYKFLCAMAMAVPIVSPDWLNESEKNGRFLETGDFVIEDPIEEAKFKFNLRRSLAKATGDKLLEGYTVVLTPNIAPPPIVEMKGIIQACGGKALLRPPTKWPEKSFIISRQEDIKNVKKISIKAPKGVRLVSVEFILTGILRHELNFEEHKLEII